MDFFIYFWWLYKVNLGQSTTCFLKKTVVIFARIEFIRKIIMN